MPEQQQDDYNVDVMKKWHSLMEEEEEVEIDEESDQDEYEEEEDEDPDE